MITKAGNALADKIIKMAEDNERIAQYKAVDFASREKVDDKIAFQKYSEIAKVYREMHGIVCAGLHQVEAEMKKL